MTSIDQLKVWSSDIYEKSLKIPPNSLKKTKIFSGAGVFVGIALAYKGFNSPKWMPYALSILSGISVSCISAIEYKQKIKEIKAKLEAAVVVEVRQLFPQWNTYSDEDILNLVKKAKDLSSQGKSLQKPGDSVYVNEIFIMDIDSLARAAYHFDIKKRDLGISALARGYIYFHTISKKSAGALSYFYS